MDTPAGRLQAWRDISFSDDAFNEFLCTIISPSYDSKKEKTITRPTEENKDQHKTSKKQEQDQQYQQDQQESIGNFEENRDNMGIGKSSFCWSGGPDSDCAGQRDQHCWSEDDFSPDEVLIDMEMHDMAIHEDNLETECNLKDVEEAREHLKRRGWTQIGGGYWKPSSRM